MDLDPLVGFWFGGRVHICWDFVSWLYMEICLFNILKMDNLLTTLQFLFLFLILFNYYVHLFVGFFGK